MHNTPSFTTSTADFTALTRRRALEHSEWPFHHHHPNVTVQLHHGQQVAGHLDVKGEATEALPASRQFCLFFPVFFCFLIVASVNSSSNAALRPQKPQGRGAKGGHPHFHTAPELCISGSTSNKADQKTATSTKVHDDPTFCGLLLKPLA